LVAIKIFTTQGQEQIAGLELAGVGANALEIDVRIDAVWLTAAGVDGELELA